MFRARSHILRMPLDCDQKAVSLRLDGLDHAVRCAGRDVQSCPQCLRVERLMVPAVHLQPRAAYDRVQPRTRVDLDRVNRRIRLRLRLLVKNARIPCPVVYVLDQCSAAGHICYLLPETHRQDRYAAGVCTAEKLHLKPAAPLVHRFGVRVNRTAIVPRVQIVAARKQHPIQVFQQRIQAGGGNGRRWCDEPRQSAGGIDRIAVCRVQVNAQSFLAIVIRPDAGGDADDGLHVYLARPRGG